MKFRMLAASLALAMSGSSFALTQDLGVLDSGGTSFSATFWRIFGFGSPLGAFADHYTFTLTGNAAAQGGAAVSMEWGALNLELDQVSLSGGTLGSTLTDTTPQAFSFGGLGTGAYSLDVLGTLVSSGGPLGVAQYTGSIQSVANTVPEPGTLGMVLAGLTVVGLMGRRRRNGRDRQ